MHAVCRITFMFYPLFIYRRMILRNWVLKSFQAYIFLNLYTVTTKFRFRQAWLQKRLSPTLNFETKSKQEGKDGRVSLTWLPDKFESNDISIQKKKFNTVFQDGDHLGFQIRMVLAASDLRVTSILPMKFLVSCPFGSAEQVQNRFSIRLLGRTILDFRSEWF